MNRITQAFENKKIFIPFITAGYPDNERFIDIIKMFENIGAGIVEIGIPFSDPLADGRVIQDSSKYVLDRGINIEKIFELVFKLRQKVKIPIAFMTYYNIVYSRGIKKFVNDTVACGVDGLIIPDLYPEEAGSVIYAAKDKLALTFLVSTISEKDRIDLIVQKTTGFIYFVSRLGVTGSETHIPEFDIVKKKVSQIKKKTDKPVAVGFGVYNKNHAQAVYSVADGVIVGSAIIKHIQENINKPNLVASLETYCKQFI